MHYQLREPSLRCVRTGRSLEPGETFYTVLYDRPEGLEREEWSQEAWQGPPPDAFSFWVGHVPPKEQSKKLEIADEVLLEHLDRLAESADPDNVKIRYVLALLLMRKKRLRFEDVRKDAEGDWMVLRCSRTKATYRILDPHLTEQAIAEVQDNLAKLLKL